MKITDLLLSNPFFYRLHASAVDRPKLRAISRVLDNFSGLKVLDLGCGPGNSANLFQASIYTGIDTSRRYINIARGRYPGLNFKVGDVTRIDWGSGFDVVLINSLLHHLTDEDVSMVLIKAGQALARNGIMIIQEPLTPAKDEWYHCLMARLDRGDYFRNLSEWKGIAKGADLFVENIDFYSLRVLGFRGYHMLSLSLKKIGQSIGK